MNRFDKALVRERIIRLVRLKSTGTPAQLAQKLEISERSVKRLIRELKADGLVLRYDHNRMTYIDSTD
jgi:predicted ArsR family transcriptional regulator